MVRYKQGELPPMSEERKAELQALSERPDSEIDFSDIPPLTEKFWKNAVRGRFSAGSAGQSAGLTINLDADIAAWLSRLAPEDCQRRANAILRRVMQEVPGT